MNANDLMNALNGIDPEFIDEAAFDYSGSGKSGEEQGSNIIRMESEDPGREQDAKEKSSSAKSDRIVRMKKTLLILVPAAAALLITVSVLFSGVMRTGRNRSGSAAGSESPAMEAACEYAEEAAEAYDESEAETGAQYEEAAEGDAYDGSMAEAETQYEDTAEGAVYDGAMAEAGAEYEEAAESAEYDESAEDLKAEYKEEAAGNRGADAEDAQVPQRKVVRVGWYDSTYNTVDEYGRRSGYAYEYQLKIAAYNGWKYEYVKGSWADLLKMLETGQIDLLSDVSYTAEREKYMLYPSMPMGTEDYYIFISPKNKQISRTDYSTLNGKKVGVNRDSVQTDFFKEWEEKNNIKADIIELTTSEDESLHMLETGELDAFVTVDSFLDPKCAVPVCKVGSSDFYFAVSKDRPDLLKDLNMALNRIHDENPYYNQQMYEKYIKRAWDNAFLSGEETEWILKHGPIRVGYQDNYMALCGMDKETGELTGVLKDKVYVIAEGVETGTQLQLLKDLGCMLVQGYYFSKPLPADEFERIFLSEKN